MSLTYDADGQRVVRDTMTDTIVYVGSHYEVRFEKQATAEDLDGDCLVTVVDIMLVVAHWGCTCCEDDCYELRYDLNGDGDIDIADVMQVAVHWRDTCEELAETVKYYTLGGKRVAMRKEPEGQADTLYYLFRDHLGSSAVVVPAGDLDDRREIRYFAYGGRRSGNLEEEMLTDRLFTDQLFDGTIGLYDYGARWYDPALGRFVQADTIVPEPGNPQALNRYSYVLNNPLRYTDPTGHGPRELAKRILRWGQSVVYPLTGPGSLLWGFPFNWRNINNCLGDRGTRGLYAEIQYAARDAGVPTILLAAALHHQAGSPDWRDWIALNIVGEPERELSRGIGQITIDEAMKYNERGLVLDPVPDETLAEALYIPEVSVRYMAAKLKEGNELIDDYLHNPAYSTISLSDENRWLLLMPVQNLGPGPVKYFFEECGGEDWQKWFANWSIYSQVLSMEDDIAWLVEWGWTDDR